jgi:hypothetical protein
MPLPSTENRCFIRSSHDLTVIENILNGASASISLALAAFYGVSCEGRKRAECFEDLVTRYMADKGYIKSEDFNALR